LTGAAITNLALAEPFIAAGAAVAFWSFFATEKGLSPRGYERNEIICAWWVPPSTREYNTKITNPYKRKNLPNIIREVKSYYLITLFSF
jgi:hypothetical protein